MKVYHAEYGIVEEKIISVYITNTETGEWALPAALKCFTNEQLEACFETALECENFESARVITNEMNNRSK